MSLECCKRKYKYPKNAFLYTTHTQINNDIKKATLYNKIKKNKIEIRNMFNKRSSKLLL